MDLRGTDLRYVLTLHLALHGPATVVELIDALDYHGFCLRGRPSKAVSDALRWEIEHGRVHRLGRGRYGPAYIPRSTEYRIHQRVLALRTAVVAERRAKRCRPPQWYPPAEASNVDRGGARCGSSYRAPASPGPCWPTG
ncbi:hypothetical protein GCM10009641_49340 [Mycobacterium cookii]|uniref:Uncharacterized protein n=1 Tax=Mycobacterium cookii TaxID=1775 RepID=A0A7I7KXY6_9MYCO|nr:hypothetical protein MCOO_23630 [Mycobacterium cookii]